MDEIDAQIEAVKAELAALRAEPEPSMGRQLAFDIPVGVARAGAGLADVLSYPVVKGLEYAGAPVETFGLSKLLSAGAEQVAPALGVQPETGTQELVSFLTPSPLSKAKLLGQAGTGLASYLGMKGAEKAMPESQYAGLVGALAGPSIATLSGKAVGAAAPKLEDIGLGLQRRARGITKADYKNAKNAVIETVDGEFSTQLKESADNLIKNKTLGTSRDPGDMYANLQAAKESTEDAIQSVLKSTEAQVGPVPPPTFDNTLNYIKNNIDSAEVDSYLAYLANKQSSLAREGQGSLTYLNQQKKVVGESWKNSPLSDAGFWRTLYRDMKQHIEKYAPEVKDLNKKKQDLVVVEPIVTRNFKASGGDFDIGAAQRLLNTTGGAGLAGGAILGAATGNVKRGLLGALTLRGLATPTGQDIVGRGLRGAASLAEALSGAPTRTAQTSQLISQKAFEEAQPYIHGTTEEGLQAITEAGNFIPKTIRYSVLGPGAIYGAPKGSMWLDPEKAAKARMWDLPKQVPIYLEPKAKIAQINNDNDWANLAKKVGMKPDELSKALWYDPTEYNAKQQLEVAEQVKKKLIQVGVDAIEMNTTPYNKTLKQIQDKYGEWWNKKLRKEDQQDWEYMATAPSEAIQRLRSRFSIYDAMGGEQQIAILNPKIAQPADKAYERLLKESPEQLRQITPDELAIISNSTKDKLLQSGYLSSKTIRDFEQLTKTPTEAPDDIDAAIEAVRQELEALRSSTPQPESVKVGKQNISIPTGEEYAPPSLVKAVMKVESAGKQEAVSPKGATGLMQLMPATAKDLGVDATDAEQNVEGGSRYLQQMINKYGKTDIALAAYNWGPGNIDKAIRKLNAERKAVTWANIMQIVKVPMETRLYVNKVLKNREVEA